jgi:enoyl-[acyl-carrier protein] reductase II
VRLIKNKFYNDIQELYSRCPTPEDLKLLLGRARAKKGMFEGDLEEGELEIGQIAGLINKIDTVDVVITEIIDEYNSLLNNFDSLRI